MRIRFMKNSYYLIGFVGVFGSLAFGLLTFSQLKAADNQDIVRSSLVVPPDPGSDSSGVSTDAVPLITAPKYNYPRLALPSFLGNPLGEPLNTPQAIEQAARWNYIHLQAGTAVSLLPTVPAQLRAANPSIKVVGYWPTDFAAPTSLPIGHPSRDLYEKVVQPYPNDPSVSWYLYDQQTPPQPYVTYYPTVDFTKADFVSWYTDFVATRIADTGLFDGIFFDAFCPSISWWDSGKPAEQQLNYQLAGFPSAAAYDVGRTAGITTFLQGLRDRVGDDFIVIGNCGFPVHWNELNGYSNEKFPQFNKLGNFSAWWDNMLSSRGGYLVANRRVHQPVYNWLLPVLTSDGSNWQTASQLRVMRMTTASALLGDGYVGLHHEPTGGAAHQAHTFWYDEYDAGGLGTGYLGQPTGPAYQMINRTGLSGAELLANPSWENGTGSWNLTATNPNGWSVDTSQAHGGTQSFRAIVTSPNPNDDRVVESWQQVTIGSIGTYSLTFWTKSDQARTLRITTTLNDTSTVARQEFMVDQTWREYQVSFYASATGFAKVYFQVGHEAGTVWVDDASVRSGMSHLWRRDFDHGSTFVNGCATGFSGCSAQTFALASPMRRLTGAQNPSLNNGAVVNSVTIPVNDGLILLSESNPPSNPTQCTEDWSCSNWSSCTAGQETRTCSDANYCGTTASKPVEARACTDLTPPNTVNDLQAQ